MLIRLLDALIRRADYTIEEVLLALPHGAGLRVNNMPQDTDYPFHATIVLYDDVGRVSSVFGGMGRDAREAVNHAFSKYVRRTR